MATLYYIHDPMCSWCWGFKPTWETLKQSLPQTITVVNLLGGLAADSNQPMTKEMQHYLQQTWQTISRQLGSEFNFDFWRIQTPRRSTYPACRAVLASQWQNQEQQMINAIQRAYYLHAQNPSDNSTLVDLATMIGLDVDRFKQDISSDQLNKAFYKQMERVRSFNVTGFPSLVLVHQGQNHLVKIDYLNAEAMRTAIIQVLNGD